VTVKKTKIERWHLVTAVLLAAVVGLLVWKRCDTGGSSSNSSDAGIEPAAATPGNLLFDLTISSPNSSWTKLQRGVGGAMGILPATLPGMIVAVADLDLLLMNELDGMSPMFGAAAGDATNPSVVLAMKLVDPRRTRTLLVDGDAGVYSGRDVPGGMTILTPVRAQALNREHHFEAAITKNGYLLVGRKLEDLTTLGPYVTRSLASRPVDTSASATIEIPKTALQTALKPKIESAWRDGKQYLLAQDERMRAEKGRAPDFGDPQSIIATLDSMFGRRMAILSDLEKIKIAIDVLDDAVVVTSTLEPDGKGEAAKSWVKSMKIGDATPVTSLPLVSTLAFASRDDEAERKAQIEQLEKGIVLSAGQRLKDPAKLHEALEALVKASDESFSIAAGLEEPAGALMKAHIRDADAANKSLRGLIDLTKADPFKEMLHVKEVTTSTEDLPGLGKINVATITRDPPKANEPPLRRGDAGATQATPGGGKTKPLGVAWVIDSENNLLVGAGSEPLVTLKVGAKPEKKLADEPSLKRFVTAIGNDASTLIVAQPLRLDPKRANLPIAPLGIAVGRKGNDAFVKIDINDGLLREIARRQMGF
jgi:hypothetical protein